MEKSYDFLNILSDVCMNLECKTPEIETSAFRRIGRFYLPTGSSKKPVTELVIYEKVLPQEFLPKYADKMIIESLAPSVLYSTFEKLYKEKFEHLCNLKLMSSEMIPNGIFFICCWRIFEYCSNFIIDNFITSEDFTICKF